MNRSHASKGFTFIEMLAVLAIIGILSAMVIYWYGSARSNALLSSTTDSIVATLESAKNNALAGKNGQSYGVKFATSTYISFIGTTYSAVATTNIAYTVDSSLSLSETISDPNNIIIFDRLTGAANTTATVTVMQVSNNANKKNILIENQGDVGVVQ
ncbi:MAG: prepilin-type N-terminal cleavage/methylation domain-containing protein [Candidatus Pacebacteria bacterium]|nr:prepilin-type N-terminal cleavage/methylation domain-containing protein [Candidatus Paceibacterota bacterium]